MVSSFCGTLLETIPIIGVVNGVLSVDEHLHTILVAFV
jgi:hypothetical protein